MRKLVVVALASSAFGGTIGAVATAAVQSQASPQAIAAAVQHVSDSQLTSAVAALGKKLGTVNSTLAYVSYQLVDAHDLSGTTSLGGKLDKIAHSLGGYGSVTVTSLLQAICRNTATTVNAGCL